MFDKIMIAQYAARTTVAAVVSSAVTTVVTNNTERTDDELIVQVPAAVVGYMVSIRLGTYTDTMVNQAAAKITRFRNRKDPK